MGIDIFDHSGHPVVLSNPEQQIWADPADINVLPEYKNGNLISYIYNTNSRNTVFL